MRVLGIIPARGGSKGVPRKNIKLLNGKPLLAYTIENARGAAQLDQVILSTDDDEIAELGRDLGVDVPFLRPPELASDDAPTFPVVMHAVEHMERAGHSVDAVCLLQPTNPLRRAEDIDGCIDLLARTGADSVISVLRVPPEYNPKWVYLLAENGELGLSTGDSEPVSRRQDLPPAFHRDGSIYVTRREVLDEFGNLYGKRLRGYEIERHHTVNIDTNEDWALAERMVRSDRTSAPSSRTRTRPASGGFTLA